MVISEEVPLVCQHSPAHCNGVFNMPGLTEPASQVAAGNQSDRILISEYTLLMVDQFTVGSDRFFEASRFTEPMR